MRHEVKKMICSWRVHTVFHDDLGGILGSTDSALSCPELCMRLKP